MKSSHILYGNSDPLILFRKIEITNDHIFQGYEIVELDGKKSSKQEIKNAFAFGLFDTNRKLIILSNPSNIENLEKRIEDAGDNYKLLLLNKGNKGLSFKKVKGQELLEEPSPYKKDEWASLILIEMAKEQGKKIPKNLASAIVSRVGNDIGVLRWELKKILQVSKSEEITIQEVSSVISPLQELSGSLIVEAIYRKDPKIFLKIINRYEKTVKNKNMKVFTEGLLFQTLFESYIVLLSREAGLSYEEISQKLRKNLWVVQNKIIPKAQNLGKKKIKKMLDVLYQMETGINFEGLDALTYFKTGIISAIVF